MEAMKQGGQSYVEIADLVDKAGDYTARILGAEAAIIVNSASSGIALSVAALVTQGNRRRSERLHQEAIPHNEIIILKGHNVQYGAPVETMVYLGGGKLIEVGYANEGRAEHVEDAISEKNSATVYGTARLILHNRYTNAWKIIQCHQGLQRRPLHFTSVFLDYVFL